MLLLRTLCCFAFISILATLPLCAQVYLEISVDAAVDTIAANADNPIFTILDVRTPGEYESGHIEGAFLRNFYDDNFNLQLDSLDKARTYLIYCQSGGRSGSTVPIMEDLGFERVYDMLGGMGSWLASGYPASTEPEGDDAVLYPVAAGVESLLADFRLFPNPSSGYLQFQTKETFDKLTVLSSLGNTILELDPSSTSVDLSYLPNGLYFLNLQLENKTTTKRFVINN